MRSVALRRSILVVLFIGIAAVRPAMGIPGPHVVVGSGFDVGRGKTFSVAATADDLSGSHGVAAVGSDIFSIDCLTIEDFTSFHIATFGGQGNEGSYQVTVVSATATGSLLPFSFNVRRFAEGDVCEPDTRGSYLVGRGAFFIGPETPAARH